MSGSYTGTKAQSGLGSTLAIGATPTTIGEISSFSYTGAQWGTADASNFQSVAREWVNTLKDNGELKLSGARVSGDAGQLAVEAAFASGAITAFVMTLPKTSTQTSSGDSYAFNALVVSREFDVDITKIINWSVTLKISDGMTLTPGS